MHNPTFRPAKNLIYLSIAQERALGCEYPLGDPWGGPAYGEFNKGGFFSSGYWSGGGIVNSVVSFVKDPISYVGDRLAELDKTVIQPIGKGLEKVGQGIANDPITFVATVAAMAIPGMQWAVPLIQMASVAAHGGSFEDVLKAGAISAATTFIAVKGSDLLMGTMKVAEGASTAYSIAGQQIGQTTARVIANGVSYAGSSAITAAATGKNIGEAALQGAIIGGISGGVGGLIQEGAFKGFADSIDSLVAKGFGESMINGIAGAAGSALAGVVTGKDMSTTAGMMLVGGAVNGLASAVKISGDFFSNNAAEAFDLVYDDYGPSNDTRSVAQYLNDKLGPVGAGFVTNTVTSILTSTFTKGDPSTFLAQQVMGNLTQSIKNAFDPNFKARYVDPIAGLIDESKAAAQGYNDAANAQNALGERINGNITTYNNRVSGLSGLYSRRDEMAARYDGMNSSNATQEQANALRDQIRALDTQIANEVNSINTFYRTDITDLQTQYAQLNERTLAAQRNYVGLADALGDKAAPLTQYLNDVTKDMAIKTAQALDPSFNPEEYRTLNGLSPTDDVGAHYISVGKDQGLYTSFEAAQGQLEDLQFKAMDKFARSMGYSGGAISLPQSIYNDALDKIQGTLGNNLKAWENFTPDSYLQQTKLPPTAIMPMWDSQSKELTVAKVIYNDGQEQLVNITTKLPEGRAAATATQILNGQADMVRGNDGNFYWTVGNDQSSAMIYDASTRQMVKAVMSPALDAAPAGATNISYNEDGSVAGYTGSDGVYRTTITGVAQDNPNDADVTVTAKRVGTDLNETDPLVQMYTYANVPDGIAANFNIKGVVQAASEVVDYMQKDASDIDKLKIATVVKSASSVMGNVGEVLGDLSVTIGLSKTNNTTLSELGKKLEGLSEAKTPEQYKAAMQDIKAMRDSAKGTDIVGINAAIAQKYPDLVGVSVFGGELFEELIQSGIAKGVGVAAGAIAATLGAPAVVTAGAIAAFGYGTAMFMDFSESYKGAKDDMTGRMYDIYKGQGYSDSQAKQMAEAAGIKAGLINGTITAVINGATPGDLNKMLFGGKASPLQDSISNYFVQKVLAAGKVAGVEFGEGLVEGTLQGAYNESIVYGVDKSKADFWKGISDSAMLESIIGAPVAAATYGVDNSLDMAVATYTLANKSFTDQLTSTGQYTTGELGTVLNNWGVNTDVRNIAVPYAVEQNPAILTYVTSLEMTQAPISAADNRSPIDATIDYIKNGYQLTGSLKAIAAEAKDQPDLKSAVEQMYYGIVGRPAEEAGLNGWMDYVKRNGVSFDQLAQAMANSPEAKVDTLYRALLGRTPDAGGQDFYVKAMLNGATLEQVAASIGNSHEAHVHQATQLYQQLLGREPEQAGLDFWVSRLDSGMPLNTIRNAFFESAEGDSYANNVKLVTNLYKTILGREPDAGGLDGWAKSLTDDFWTYDQVVDHFKNSPEANSHDGHVNQVKYLYRSILGREAEPEGLANAVALLDSGVTMDQLRPMFVNSPENAEYLRVQAAEKTLSDLGVTDPTARLDFLNAQFDPRYTTQKEAIDQLAARGLTNVTAADAAQYVGKTGTYQGDQMNDYVNKNMVSALELQAAAKQEGYDLTQQDMSRLVGRGVEAEVIAKFIQEVDPKATTTAEATQFFMDQGYNKATAAEIAQFVKSAPEAEVKAAVAAYVDPHQVTRQEALNYFSSFNYMPTDAEINTYVVQGADVFQNAIKQKIGDYVDPRYVDSSEVEAAFKTLGLQAPLTLGDIARLSGQYDESQLAAKAKEYLPVATANAIYALYSGNTSPQVVTLTDIQSAINNIKFPEGISKQDVTVAIADYLTKNPGLTLSQVAAKISEATAGLATTDSVKTAITDSLKQYATKQDITNAIANIQFPAGITKTDVSDAISAYMKDNPGLTISQVADKVSELTKGLATSADVNTSISNALKGYATQQDINAATKDLRDALDAAQKGNTSRFDNIDAAIKDLKDAGLTESQVQTIVTNNSAGLSKTFQDALASAVKGNATALDGVKAALNDKIDGVQSSLSTALGDQYAAFNAKVQTLMDQGSAYQQATQKALTDLGLTVADLGTNFNTKLSDLSSTLNTQVNSARTALEQAIADAKASGLQGDAALQAAINAVSSDLGTTKADFLTQLGATEASLKTQFAGQLGDVRTALEQAISEAKAAGLQGDAALQAAISVVSGELGTTKESLLSQLGTTEANLKAEFSSQLAAVQQYTQEQVQQAAAMLQDQITKNQNAGMDAIAATNKAISDLSDYLGVSTDTIRTEISAVNSDLAAKIQQASQENQQYTQQQVSQATALLQAQITANQNAGMDAIAATNKAVQDVSSQLGITATALQSQIAASNTQLAQQIADAQAASQAYTQEQVQQSQTAIMDKMAQYEAAGKSRDEALSLAIGDVSTQLGTTAADLLTKMGTNQQTLLDTIAASQSQTQTQIADTKKAILDQMAAYQKLNMDADTALSLAVSGVAQDLGTTKSDLLAQLGTTETNLKSELAAQSQALSGQIQNVQNLVGQQGRQATAADLATMQGMVAGTTPVNLAYDTNNDGKVDQTDLTAVQDQLAFNQNENIQQQVDPNTGINIWVDKTTGQQVSAPASLGGQWAPTGIYSVLEQQKAQQAATAKAQAASAKTAQQKSQFGTLMGMLFNAPDVMGQTTTVKTPDPAKINYIYDFSSIFANPSQASMMPSPYGAVNTVMPMQPQQKQQAANQPLFQLASGFAEGGIVGDNDIQVGGGGSIDDLLNILKGNG